MEPEPASNKRKREEKDPADTGVLQKLLGDEMVSLYVGPKKELLRVHKQVLCTKVPYFNGLFDSNDRHVSPNSAKFDKATVESFEILVEWAYQGEIRELTLTRFPEGLCVTSYNAVLAFALADSFRLAELMDKVLESLIKLNRAENSIPGYIDASLAFLNTSQNSAMRRYIVRAWHWVFVTYENKDVKSPCNDDMQKMLKESSDFAREFIELTRNTNGKILKDPRTLPFCEFHYHGKSEKCPYY